MSDRRALPALLLCVLAGLLGSRGAAETPKDAFIRQAVAGLQQLPASAAPPEGVVTLTVAVAFGDKLHGRPWQGTVPAGTTLADLAANPSQFNVPRGLLWPQGSILVLHRDAGGVQRSTYLMQNVKNSRAFPRILADHDVILAEVLSKH